MPLWIVRETDAGIITHNTARKLSLPPKFSARNFNWEDPQKFLTGADLSQIRLQAQRNAYAAAAIKGDAIPNLRHTLVMSATAPFPVQHIVGTTGTKNVDASFTYADTGGNTVSFDNPQVVVNCEPTFQADSCPEPAEVVIEGCEDTVAFDAGDLILKDAGRWTARSPVFVPSPRNGPAPAPSAPEISLPIGSDSQITLPYSWTGCVSMTISRREWSQAPSVRIPGRERG